MGLLEERERAARQRVEVLQAELREALEPLVRGIPPIRSRRGPRRRRPAKLHADKGYDYEHLRRWLRKRGIRHRIARKGTESCGSVFALRLLPGQREEPCVYSSR